MGDNEIIKALECCSEAVFKEDCKKLKCPFFDNEIYNCMNVDDENAMHRYSLDLINRQKAEIELLKKQIVFEVDRAYDRGAKFGAKVAVKEFAEKVKSNCEWFLGCNISRNKLIDGIVKEMTEESNDQQKT